MNQTQNQFTPSRKGYWAEQGYKCQQCGYDRQLVFHHINYRTNEGIILCRLCHTIEHLNKVTFQELINQILERLKNETKIKEYILNVTDENHTYKATLKVKLL